MLDSALIRVCVLIIANTVTCIYVLPPPCDACPPPAPSVAASPALAVIPVPTQRNVANGSR